MKITVTSTDIEAGRRRDPSECPVARALRRSGIAHFGVTGMLVIIQDGRTHIPLVLPAAVQEWILDFDWGSAMEPIEFELNWPRQPEEQAEPERVALAEPQATPAPAAPVQKSCPTRRRPALPALSFSAKGLLARSFRCCQPRHKGRGRALAPEAHELVGS